MHRLCYGILAESAFGAALVSRFAIGFIVPRFTMPAPGRARGWLLGGVVIGFLVGWCERRVPNP